MISLNIWISISNEIPILTNILPLQISVKPDPNSALDKPQKHTFRGFTSGVFRIKEISGSYSSNFHIYQF